MSSSCILLVLLVEKSPCRSVPMMRISFTCSTLSKRGKAKSSPKTALMFHPAATRFASRQKYPRVIQESSTSGLSPKASETRIKAHAQERDSFTNNSRRGIDFAKSKPHQTLNASSNASTNRQCICPSPLSDSRLAIVSAIVVTYVVRSIGQIMTSLPLKAVCWLLAALLDGNIPFATSRRRGCDCLVYA